MGLLVILIDLDTRGSQGAAIDQKALRAATAHVYQAFAGRRQDDYNRAARTTASVDRETARGALQDLTDRQARIQYEVDDLKA